MISAKPKITRSPKFLFESFNQVMNYYTLYTVKNNKTGVITGSEISHNICFAAYNPKDYDPNNTIKIFILKEYQSGIYAEMIFTKEQVFNHLEKLNNLGFPLKFVEEDQRYVVTLEEKEYLNKTHIRVALDFIRLLWETDINKILKKYYEMSVENQEGDYLEILQAIQATIKINQGHTLPSGGYYQNANTIFSSKECIEALSKNKNHMHGSGALWRELQEKIKEQTPVSSEQLKEIKSFKLDKPGAINKIIEIINKDKIEKIKLKKMDAVEV